MPKKQHKLHVIGHVNKLRAAEYPLRLDKELSEWIEKNTTGSKNSVINLLIKIATKEIDPLLEKSDLTEVLENHIS
jgi:hypothetical protein